MIGQQVKQALERYIPKDNILYDEPMNRHTSFRTGGPADCFIQVSERKPLAKLIQYLNRIEIPYFILGNGTNLLVGDGGYSGIILQLMGEYKNIRCCGRHIYAGSGAGLSLVAKEAARNGLSGLEFADGIPGTVGGAVIMNAGAYGGEMKQVVEQITVLDGEGNELTIPNEQLEFGYRTSSIKGRPYVVTECTFLLTSGEEGEIKAKMAELMEQRRAKQPLEYPSAGSTFKRPEGNFAGKLIMDAGLSGLSVGGAMVSPKHCGFIVNTGAATAKDVKDLIELVQREVQSQFCVDLEPEVIFLGKF